MAIVFELFRLWNLFCDFRINYHFRRWFIIIRVIDWIHTPLLCGPANILTLIWMKNIVKVKTNIGMWFKTKKSAGHQKAHSWEKIIFGVCLLFPFDVFEWNEDSAINFLTISFDSVSDYVVLFILQLRAKAKNAALIHLEIREFSGENNPIHYALYSELENATRFLQLYRVSHSFVGASYIFSSNFSFFPSF